MSESRSGVLHPRLRRVLMIWAGLIALFFVFGDRLLRLMFHCGFMTSVVIWAGSLAILLVCGVVVVQVMGG